MVSEHEIYQAKNLLKKAGYQTENLWCVNDVRNVVIGCNEEQAHEVLVKALTNEATMDQIWYAIKDTAESMGFKCQEED